MTPSQDILSSADGVYARPGAGVRFAAIHTTVPAQRTRQPKSEGRETGELAARV